MAGHSNMAGWNELAVNVVTDKIPPGWTGPDGEVTEDQWIKNLDRWSLMCSLDDHDAKVSAVEFRLNATLQEIMSSFPEKYGDIPMGTEAEAHAAMMAASPVYSQRHTRRQAKAKAKAAAAPGAIPAAPGPGGGAPAGDEGAPEPAEGAEGAPLAGVLDPEDLRPMYTQWGWFLDCIRQEWGGPAHEGQTRSYDRYTDFRRPRGVSLRKWVTEHINRHFLADKRAFKVNNVARSHYLLKCGRMTDDQRRWALAPVEGDLEQYPRILKAVQNMPLDISNQIANFVEMSTEEYDYICEVLDEIESFYNEWTEHDSYHNADEMDAEEWQDDNNSVTPSQSVSQVGSSTPASSMNLMAEDEESDGDTEGDQEKASSFLQYRKQRRDFKRKWGQPLRSRKGKGSSSKGSQGKPSGGGGFTPWWQQGDGPKIKGYRDSSSSSGKGSQGGGPPRFWNQNTPSSAGSGSFSNKGKGKKGKKGKGKSRGVFSSVLAWMVSQGASVMLDLMHQAFPSFEFLPVRRSQDLLPFAKDVPSKMMPTMDFEISHDNDLVVRAPFMDRMAPLARTTAGPDPLAPTKVVIVDAYMNKVLQEIPYENFIVGREPAATRSLLVDVGASINLNGHLWREGLEREVLHPMGLNATSSPGRARVGGVGKSVQKSLEMKHVPNAILAQDRWRRKVVIYATFHSQEIEGACPALWCLASITHWKGHVLCPVALVRVLLDDEYWMFCEPTDSGHLLLPIDNWEADTARQKATEISLSFQSEERHVDMYLADTYHGGAEDGASELTSGAIPSLETWLTEDAEPASLGGEQQQHEEKPLPMLLGEELKEEEAKDFGQGQEPARLERRDFAATRTEVYATLHAKGIRVKSWDGKHLMPIPPPRGPVPCENRVYGGDVLGRPLGVPQRPSDQAWTVWPFQSGSQDFLKTAASFFAGACGFPVDLNTSWLLNNYSHIKVLFEWQERQKPLFIFFHPRNNPTGLCNRSDKAVRNFLRDQEREGVPMMLELAKRQTNNGRCFALLVPLGTEWCNEDELAEFQSLCLCEDGDLVHMCAHGLRNPGDGTPEKRPHLLYSNVSMTRASLRCPGEPKHSRHGVRPGGFELPTVPESFWRALSMDMRDELRRKRAERRLDTRLPKRGQREVRERRTLRATSP